MSTPRTKADLLRQMETSHQAYYGLLAQIPRHRMDEEALYDTWTVKDLVAHIGWWAQTGVERVAAVRRGEPEQIFSDFAPINAQVLEKYRGTSLAEVQEMDRRGWEGLAQHVQELTNKDLFEPGRFPGLNGRPMVFLIIEETYGHHEDHLDDLKAWMRQNKLP